MTTHISVLFINQRENQANAVFHIFGVVTYRKVVDRIKQR